MGLNIVNPSSYAGGAFFKPADHMTDLAILVEPKRIDREQPNTYQGKTTYRDEVTADITVFRTSESLEKGEPSEVIKGARIAYGMLTSTLDKILKQGAGGAIVSVIRKVPTRNGAGYVFRDVEGSVLAQVAACADKREAALAEAVASAPDFD
ncbi:hypothetical protein AB0J80_36160 [Actinoplanes sp. NPDC049548]|uniref:hypothetical protein n=1 Tax=Actinoplanes sp. NPDC049548 TaxID=3155152 RepID=UPI003445685E